MAPCPNTLDSRGHVQKSGGLFHGFVDAGASRPFVDALIGRERCVGLVYPSA